MLLLLLLLLLLLWLPASTLTHKLTLSQIMARHRVNSKKSSSTVKQKKTSSKKTPTTKKPTNTKKKKTNPLDLVLRRCKELIPYHEKKDLGRRELYYLSQRYKILSKMKVPSDVPTGHYVINQILCDRFIDPDSFRSRHYLVCWEGFDLPEWVHQDAVPAAIRNAYHNDGIVPYHAYEQLINYLDEAN